MRATTIRKDRLEGAARESQAVVILAGRPVVVTIADVTPELADLLGLPLANGAVIRRRLWQSEFGGRDVVGQTMLREGRETRITSVGPEWLDGLYAGRPVDIWQPLHESPRRGEPLWVLARLRDGLRAQ